MCMVCSVPVTYIVSFHMLEDHPSSTARDEDRTLKLPLSLENVSLVASALADIGRVNQLGRFLASEDVVDSTIVVCLCK